MESSSSPSANPSDNHHHWLADVLGTLIGILTLTLPLIAIAYYSAGSNPEIPPPSSPHPLLEFTGD